MIQMQEGVTENEGSGLERLELTLHVHFKFPLLQMAVNLEGPPESVTT